MTFAREVFPAGTFARDVAARIASAAGGASSVVLTGGTTAEKIYTGLARLDVPWAGMEVLFSDERCVPPTDPASNYGMAERLLFDGARPRIVHRMRGEDPPEMAARSYHDEIAPVVKDGIDLVLLGMGVDAHIGAMFPGSMALDETDRLCVAVDRPDGMKGLTLTPPAILAGRKVLLPVAGEAKAATVKRVIEGNQGVASCPARLLVSHPDVTFLLDEAAASLLSYRGS